MGKPGFGISQIGAPNPLVPANQDAQKLSEAFIKVAEAVTPTVVFIEVKSETGSLQIPEGHEFFFKDFPFLGIYQNNLKLEVVLV